MFFAAHISVLFATRFSCGPAVRFHLLWQKVKRIMRQIGSALLLILVLCAGCSAKAPDGATNIGDQTPTPEYTNP
ncbi:hypothetical protein Plim_2900 [Planctopirus limnophila DSM 3776]|uniref:Uncharacterized protein n=1 Tax=Planctopirus limnophila (strain ATCC 43296 / DSM 3776 / IFAM 1008 / Mu 290) TaxID=521674 RepID=D5SRZ8_PLAL2|nr:hypothetical protein Plim_2900 [Planctopirus limnophila DSM 3776]